MQRKTQLERFEDAAVRGAGWTLGRDIMQEIVKAVIGLFR